MSSLSKFGKTSAITLAVYTAFMFFLNYTKPHSDIDRSLIQILNPKNILHVFTSNRISDNMWGFLAWGKYAGVSHLVHYNVNHHL